MSLTSRGPDKNRRCFVACSPGTYCECLGREIPAVKKMTDLTNAPPLPDDAFNEYWKDAVGKPPFTHAKAIAKHAWDAGQATLRAQLEQARVEIERLNKRSVDFETGEFDDKGVPPWDLEPHFTNAMMELTTRKAYAKGDCAHMIAEGWKAAEAATARADANERDAKRWAYVKEMCYSQEMNERDYVGLMLPEDGHAKSTSEMFERLIDAALSGAPR